MEQVIIIGGGLAGSEAALQLAERKIKVILYEQRPIHTTPAHTTDKLAELVCSNSLKSQEETNAHGLLKKEIEILGSILLDMAKKSRISGGKALVVDREKFAESVTREIESHPYIEVRRERVDEIPEDNPTPIIIATGPLTDGLFAENLKKLIGEEFLNFYDAISPIVDAESLNMEKLYFKDRHGIDNDAYLNAPMTEEEYDRFYNFIVNAESFKVHDFDKEIPYFEGCLPIEEMAKRGRLTLVYGPLSPKGLKAPKTGKTPFAVVQLRAENKEKTMYSLVGFQTRLKRSEQLKLIHLIPGLENAKVLRYGQIHRNTFINAPGVISRTLNLKRYPHIFIAGQLSGTEGYVEAIMGGLISSIFVYNMIKDKKQIPLPEHTMSGALLKYISEGSGGVFQPMNANMGLLGDVPSRLKGMRRREFKKERAIKEILRWKETMF